VPYRSHLIIYLFIYSNARTVRRGKKIMKKGKKREKLKNWGIAERTPEGRGGGGWGMGIGMGVKISRIFLWIT